MSNEHHDHYKVFDRVQPAQILTSRKTMKNETALVKPAAYIGLDWADKEHDLCLRAGEDGPLEKSVIPHQPADLIEWITKLRKRFEGKPVLICTEQSRGALINFLMQFDFVWICPINPKSQARFREAFRPSGAKDDDHDAEVMCEVGRLYSDRFQIWKPQSASTRLIDNLSEHRRHVVDKQTELVLELQSNLKLYYPLILDLFKDLSAELPQSFLAKWTTLSELKKATPQTIRELFYAENSRSEKLIKERLALIQEAKPLTEDRAAVFSGRLATLDLVRRLRAIRQSIQEYDQAIAKEFAQHADADIFTSLPGAGAVLAPRLLAAMGEDRSRFENCLEPQTLYGIAPITVQSGESKTIRFRKGCNHFKRQSFHEFAASSTKFCDWAADYLQTQLKNEKMTYHQAVRSLAFKWIRIIFRMWKDRVPYNESRYLEGLKKHGSPYASPKQKANRPGRKKTIALSE